MTARPRRTTTLVGPDRLVLVAATAGLVALASGATALLVLTGTSSVSVGPAPTAPLSTPSPGRSPGVIVLPPDQARSQPRARHIAVGPISAPRAVVPPAPAAPTTLPFVDLPAAPAIVPAVVRVPAVPVPVVEPPYVPAPDPSWVGDNPGRHLALGHAKHNKPAKAVAVKQLKRAEHAAGKHAKHVNHRKHSDNGGGTEHEQAD